MKARSFFWSIASALAGVLFGFDSVVISGAEQKNQSHWTLSPDLPATALPVEANQVADVALVSRTTCTNPFLEIQLDAVVTQPDGIQLRAPGFWAGGADWRFRYASDKVGTHTWRTECTDTANVGLHGVTGSIQVVASTSVNPLFRHGPIRVASDHRHFEHADGTPFFWLGDTWL